MSIDTVATAGLPFHVTRVTLRAILPDEEDEWKELMEEEHPQGNAQFSGHQIKYVAEHRGQAVALLSFSACAYRLADRDRWIGWSADQLACRRHFVVQNSRFLILGKTRRKNLASRVLSLCAKQIPVDWKKRYGFPPLILETFVDPVHFRGTCYQAANWKRVGATRGFRRDGREFYCEDSYPKDIWLKQLRPGARDLLRAEQLPADLQPFEKELSHKEMVKKIQVAKLCPLFERLHQVGDPRKGQGKRYPLGCCLSLVTCAVLAGCEGLRECAEFAASLSQSQLKALRSWRHPKTGKYTAPSHVTMWRIISSVDADEFESAINSWLTDVTPLPESIAIDGKVLRATLQNEDGAVCAVSAVSHRDTALFLSKRLHLERDTRSVRPRN